MSNRSARAIAYGFVAVALYLVAAAVSGSISVIARRPLLDGVTPPPPYRYVKPPPEATTQEKPASAKVTIKLDPPELGAGVFSTQDQQATLVTEPGVFPSGTQGPVTLTIDPLDPAQFARAPKGSRVVGNVYRFEAKDKSGAVVGAFANAGHIVLVYPAHTAAVFNAQHALLTSKDGRSWRRLEANDSPAQQQLSGDVMELGYLAVSESGGQEEGGGVNAGVIVAAVVGGIAALGGAGWYVKVRREAARRRARALARRRARDASPKKRR